MILLSTIKKLLGDTSNTLIDPRLRNTKLRLYGLRDITLNRFKESKKINKEKKDIIN